MSKEGMMLRSLRTAC